MQDSPEQMPPCGGNWIRTPDGHLLPRDEPTARAAGINAVPPEFVPAPALDTDTQE